MTTTTQTVREIALEQPSSIRVFEKFGIDYCCGGRKPLAEACTAGNLEVNAVIAALEADRVALTEFARRAGRAVRLRADRALSPCGWRLDAG